MRIIIYTIIIVFSYFIFDIGNYHELNDIAIIEEISVEKNNNIYIITLKEKKAIKGSSGIEYLYDYYISSSSTIEGGFAYLNKYSNKVIIFDHVNTLITNIENINDELGELDFSIDNIIYTSADIDIRKSET